MVLWGSSNNRVIDKRETNYGRDSVGGDTARMVFIVKRECKYSIGGFGSSGIKLGEIRRLESGRCNRGIALLIELSPEFI